ncbi:MAG: phosphoenolpyruvate carboxykinase (ATP) [Sporolactobacillus sp.]
MVMSRSVLSQFKSRHTFVNLSVPELMERALKQNEGVLTNCGALAVTTGKYTGRSPNDKFFVRDSITEHTIDWTRNQATTETIFLDLQKKMIRYLNQSEHRFVFKGYAGADPAYQLSIEIVNEHAWQNLFCNQLFIVPNPSELRNHESDFTVICAPGFKADPAVDGTKSEAFIIISFAHHTVLIGGTEYAGEIKKAIFTIMNFILPQRGILPMHCSANQNAAGQSALFFGLSGTGKTTLSNSSDRFLIGDDEHGWSTDGVFNFEGGCYAKTIRLSKTKELQIYNSIGFGTILENVIIHHDDRKADYDNNLLTENTRAAYSLDGVANALLPSIGAHPSSIIFLTADAFGVLPPISVLTPEQAMYQFMSGYTSKLAGTERGVSDPEATFSTCFGSPFMPLLPSVYAELLGRLMIEHHVRAYLVNTGWTGGAFGTGKRIKLAYTRRIIDAALNDDFTGVETLTDLLFGLHIPKTVNGVPEDLLLPWKAWADQAAYQRAARQLCQRFNENFKTFPNVPDAIRKAGPSAV